MQTRKQIRMAEIAIEILFLKQAIKAQAIQRDLELTPEDRIRQLDQQNYWYRRLLTERDDSELDYTTVMEAMNQPTPTQPTLWATPKLIDKRGTHSDECICKQCVFAFRNNLTR